MNKLHGVEYIQGTSNPKFGKPIHMLGAKWVHEGQQYGLLIELHDQDNGVSDIDYARLNERINAANEVIKNERTRNAS